MEPRIAIVDDDQAVRDALQRMLRSHGFATAVFGSAQEFLQCAERRSASCLIVDIRMPAMSGLALHDHLIETGCRTPTILITARPSSNEQKRALDSGVASYLAKPLGEQTLLDAIHQATEGAEPVTAAASPGPGSAL